VRIAQEATLNSVRHASPHQLKMDLTYEERCLTLRVIDDGCGFEVHDASRAGHYGIMSMEERARRDGGALTLVSTPGRGTEVTAVLPVAS
jgi:signal transduction histidine kinase